MDPLEPYRIVVAFPVHWGEMDAFQHVNNASYFRYFETARIAYFDALGEIFRGPKLAGIVAETSCRYLRPLKHPDDLRIGVRTASWYEHGFLHEYALFSRAAGSIAAFGTARIVAYDYTEGKKVAVPEALVHRLEQVERGPIPKGAKPT